MNQKRRMRISSQILDVKDLEDLAKPSYLEGMPYHAATVRLVERVAFQNTYFFIVFVYAICMGFELEFDDPDYADNWFSLNCLFALSFVVEVVCKLYAYGHNYFRIGWFVLEFLTSAGACMTLGMNYYDLAEGYEMSFTCIKLSRIILLGKLFSVREEFQVIVVGFTRSLKDLYGVFFVVGVICYGCTLFCYSVIGKHDYTGTRWETDHELYFGGIMRTMMSLFSMIIVDEWAGYARPVYFEQPPVVMFFFLFSIVLTMGLLNVITGMVVDTVNSVKADHTATQLAKSQVAKRQKLEEIVEVVFADGANDITEEDFKNHHDKVELLDLVESIDFPHTFTLKDLFTVLDFPGQRMMIKSKFIDGIMCLIHGTHFQQHCTVLLSMNKVWRDIVSLRKEMRAMHHIMVQKYPVLAEFDADSLKIETGPTTKALKGGGYSDASDFTGASKNALGDFTIEDLVKEFEAERKDIHLRKVAGGEKRLKKLESKIIDVAHMHDSELLNIPLDYVTRFPFHSNVQQLVEHVGFQGFFFLLVTVYSIVMGAELNYDSEEASDNWFYVNCFFTVLFSLEMLLKLYTYGHRYFRILWFDLEFLTCGASIVTLAMHYKGWTDAYSKTFTVLKLSRIILLGKLFSMREEFETIVVGFSRSLMSLWGIMFVLIVINYGCTLFCYSIIGKHDYSQYDDYDHDLYWGNIPRTMITMFSMMITDNWGGYSRVVWEEQPPVILFFYIYTILLTWGLLNIVTGMIVDTVSKVRQDHEKLVQERKMSSLKDKLSRVVTLVFADRDSDEISEEDFLSHASREELIEMLEVVDLPHTFTVKDFFILLDVLGQKQMTREHFVDGVLGLLTSSEFHQDCSLLLSVHKIRRGVVGLRKELRTIHHRVRAAGALERVPAPMPDASPLTVVRMGESKPLILKTPKSSSSNPWEQLRSMLQSSALHHAKEELMKRWQELEWEYKAMDPLLRRQHCVMPSLSTSTQGSAFSALQEQYFVWNKLTSAITRENLYDLRQALDHARDVGLGESSSAILFTYCDALTRHHETVGFSLEEVLDAVRTGSFEHGITMVLEMAINQGADRNLLLNALTRLCGDTNDRIYATSPPPNSIGGASPGDVRLALTNGSMPALTNGQNGVMPKSVETNESNASNLLAVLQAKAGQHARHELNVAWEELDSAYATPAPAGGAPAKTGVGPGYSPFSNQEEHFFIRNQIVNAIQQESLPEIRRALTYAMAFGIDPKSVEIEAAYRDTLAKYQASDSYDTRQVSQVLQDGDWWSALDLIIGAALAKGSDRNMLLKMIGKVCMTSQFTISMPMKAGYHQYI